MAGFKIDETLIEFSTLKQDNLQRNYDYYLLRQAMKGNFRWPRDWPIHIPKLSKNMCKPIVEKMASYLIGNSFSWNINRPNSAEFRETAERSEKILDRLLDLSRADVQFVEGAKTGSKLGRTIFKVYKKGAKGAEHACFSYCQPDYFYGVPIGAESPGEFSIVYYSYPIDKAEAVRRFGAGDYKTEGQMADGDRYDRKREQNDWSTVESQRRIPVLEVWSKDSYLLQVGGITKYNGENPYKWSDTNEGYIPFVVIENIRSDEDGFGEADIQQGRIINERINYLLSRRDHIVNRWLTPTITWEGAPQNYAEILAQSMSGGGAIPMRLGSRIGFLSYDRPNEAVAQQMAELRATFLEVCGMNEASYQGIVQGSINTGPALDVQFQPLLSTIQKKRKEWEIGLKALMSMLLQLQEDIGESRALGQAVVLASSKTADAVPGNEQMGPTQDGMMVNLSGKDIKGLRDVSIAWPGVLPKDDFAASRLEMEKLSAGMQSVYTTMEKLGEEYPNDEIQRIRRENEDPSLKGEKVAQQTRAMTPLIKQQQDQQFQMMQQQQMAEQQAMMAQQGGQPGMGGMGQEMTGQTQAGSPPSSNDIGERMRQLAQSTQPVLDESGEFPTFGPMGG
jgi:hypothetical protein